MAKVIWKGEDTATEPGPSFTTCYGGIKFPKDVAVVITDPETLRKARGNLNFKVIEEKSHGENAKTQEDKSEPESIEDKGDETENFDYVKTKNTSGYTPVKKKVRKRKPVVERTDVGSKHPGD